MSDDHYLAIVCQRIGAGYYQKARESKKLDKAIFYQEFAAMYSITGRRLMGLEGGE